MKWIRQRLGYTQADIANAVKVSQGSVGNWESGRNGPSARQAKRLADFLSVSVDYLLYGASSIHEPSTPYRAGPKPRRVPVVSWAAASAADHGRFYDDLANQLDEWIETDCRDQNAFALIVEGDSMEPRFYAGDRIIFLPNAEPRNGDFVVCRLNETGGVLFKNFHRTGPDGQNVKLTSLNTKYRDLEYPISAFRFIYPAYELQSKLRR